MSFEDRDFTAMLRATGRGCGFCGAVGPCRHQRPPASRLTFAAGSKPPSLPTNPLAEPTNRNVQPGDAEMAPWQGIHDKLDRNHTELKDALASGFRDLNDSLDKRFDGVGSGTTRGVERDTLKLAKTEADDLRAAFEDSGLARRGVSFERFAKTVRRCEEERRERQVSMSRSIEAFNRGR